MKMYSRIIIGLVLVLGAILINADLQGIDLRKKAIKHIKNHIICQVCHEAVKQIHWQAESVRDQLESHNILVSEDHFVNLTEALCNPYTPSGEWITYWDIVKTPPRLGMEMQGKIGKCRRECETIAYVCDQLMLKHDYAITDWLVKKKSAKYIDKKVCTRECAKKVPEIDDSCVDADEEWEEADEQGRMMMASLLQRQKKEKEDQPFTGDYIHNYVEEQLALQREEKDTLKRRALRRARFSAEEDGIEFDRDEWETKYDAMIAKQEADEKERQKREREGGGGGRQGPPPGKTEVKRAEEIDLDSDESSEGIQVEDIPVDDLKMRDVSPEELAGMGVDMEEIKRIVREEKKKKDAEEQAKQDL